MVSTHLKHIGQNGNLPQIGLKIKNLKPPQQKPCYFTECLWLSSSISPWIMPLAEGIKGSPKAKEQQIRVWNWAKISIDSWVRCRTARWVPNGNIIFFRCFFHIIHPKIERIWFLNKKNDKNIINKIIIARLGVIDLAISADGQRNHVSKIHSSGSNIELS